MSAAIGIDCDPMIAHSRLQLSPIRIGDKDLGLLQGHMAIYAVLRDLGAELRILATSVNLVATQTVF